MRGPSRLPLARVVRRPATLASRKYSRALFGRRCVGLEGRSVVTKNSADWGAFKTPTLREIARTAPYMHDGSIATLEEVVDYYDKGGIANKNLDEKIKPLKLSATDKKDLVEFMKALSGEGWQAKLVAPKVFPK